MLFDVETNDQLSNFGVDSPPMHRQICNRHQSAPPTDHCHASPEPRKHLCVIFVKLMRCRVSCFPIFAYGPVDILNPNSSSATTFRAHRGCDHRHLPNTSTHRSPGNPTRIHPRFTQLHGNFIQDVNVAFFLQECPRPNKPFAVHGPLIVPLG